MELIFLAIVSSLGALDMATARPVTMSDQEFERAADGCGDDIECEFDQLRGTEK